MTGWLLAVVLLIALWVGGCIGHAIGTGEVAEMWDARPRRVPAREKEDETNG